ncbi:hypothetical protein C8Q80DRAFT_512237 [Daedaleopsis nitida]|nr:hypothetical protein C8Q80DRAFT_512237 [Daedaleopsis nitida]
MSPGTHEPLAFPATSAVSKALHCHEILSESLEYLAPGTLDPQSLPRQQRERRIAQGTLAALARVSHAFTYPALDVLWRVTNILALLSVLPTFELKRDGEYIYLLSGEPSSKAWSHFMQHAKRVKELDMSSSRNAVKAPVSPSVWTFLSIRTPQGGFLPRLQRLEMDARPGDPGHIILLSSSIRHLTINVYYPTSTDAGHHTSTTQTILDVVRRTTIPHLESLRVNRVNFLPLLEPGPRAKDLQYAGFTHLRALDIEHKMTLKRSQLDALARFPHLRKLGLTISFEPNADPPLSDAFPVLRELKLAAKWHHVVAFFDKAAPKNLEALTLNIARYDRTDLASISNFNLKIPTSLQRYSICYSERCVLQYCASVLEGIMQRDQITHLSMKIDKLYNLDLLPLDEREFKAMVNAWPNLVELDFAVKSLQDYAQLPGEFDDAPTMDTLVRFVEAHPHLVRLTLPYVHVPTDPAMQPKSRVLWHMVPQLDHGLQQLRISLVDARTPSDLRCVALLYDRLFPNLDLTDAEPEEYRTPWNDGARAHFGYWVDVEQMLVALQMGRSGVHRSGSAPPVEWL